MGNGLSHIARYTPHEVLNFAPMPGLMDLYGCPKRSSTASGDGSLGSMRESGAVEGPIRDDPNHLFIQIDAFANTPTDAAGNAVTQCGVRHLAWGSDFVGLRGRRPLHLE